MGVRGDTERSIAVTERERAAEQLVLAERSEDEETRAIHERAAFSHSESARLHEALAGVYDRHDD